MFEGGAEAKPSVHVRRNCQVLEEEQIAHGRATRAEVIGHDVIDAVYASIDEFELDQQDYISAQSWGDVFNRPGLSKQTRLLINIAALATMGEQDTLKNHVRAAIRLGCSRVEIREAIIQAGTCAGPIRAALACRAARVALQD